ncbi:MAG TPA: MFS transporter [Planctomycetota bacterium]|nr:MFS transporter [Planctomycetota bacterium]
MSATAPSRLGALRHRNFRLLFAGQFLSLVGTWMQSAAVLWHIASLVPPEEKALALGGVGLVKVVPIVVFALAGGVLADALDRRRMMFWMQCLMAASAGLQAVLTLQGLTSIWPLYILTGVNSAAAAFEGPARQSLIPAIVPREDLPNAISLNTMAFQMAAVAGPALTGIAYQWLGPGWIYAVNAVSFLAAIAAVILLRDLPRHAPENVVELSPRSALEGLRFVFSHSLIRSTMLVDFFATFFSSAMALLPIFTQDILGRGAGTYGLLYSAPAIGAALTSLILLRVEKHIVRRGRVLLWSVAAYGLATIVFGLSKSFWLMFVCLALTGAADTVSMVIRNVLRQLTTPPHMRGRMTSVNMIFFLGGPQLGEMEAGALAHKVGAAASVVIGGIGSLISTAWIAKSTPALRNYRRE